MRRELRDHSEPCECGEPWARRDFDVWVCSGGGCPGGKLIVMEQLERARDVRFDVAVWVEVTP